MATEGPAAYLRARCLLAWRPLAGLGTISYSVYLTHGSFLAELARLVAPWHLGGWRALALFAGAILLGVIRAGATFYRLVERPALRRCAAAASPIGSRLAPSGSARWRSGACMNSSPEPAQRLHFLDALRGLAALAVVAAHIQAQLTDPTGAGIAPTRYFSAGQFGVVLFFLVSGFVIPMTLERGGSLRAFWVKRAFRLYPLYWASLALALALGAAGRFPLLPTYLAHPARATLANLTMAPILLAAPPAIVVYWTLAYELLFYALAALLFLRRLHLHSAFTTSALLLVALLVDANALTAPGGGSVRDAAGVAAFHLAALFVGTAFYRPFAGQASVRTLLPVLGLASAAIAVTYWVLLRDARWDYAMATPASWLAALGLFLLACRGWLCRYPRWLVWVGTVSYSLYLLHCPIIWAVPPVGPPLAAVATWLAVALALAALAYRWVEAPGITLGRRLVARHLVPTRRQASFASASE
jgi:peptidoglycan/LPS O-acetylase OafA/YrhL